MYIVRDATEEDLDQLVEIARDVLKESPTYTHMEFDKEKSAWYLMKAITREPNWFIKVVALKDGEIAGFILAICETSIFGHDKLAYDVTIMVPEMHRGRCLKQLITIIYAYKEWALKEGAKVVKMGVSSMINIEKAELFFDKLGFKKIGSQHAIILGE